MRANVTLSVDVEVLAAAKDLGINLSRFFEECLRAELDVRAVQKDETKTDKVKELRVIIANLRQQLREQAQLIQKLQKENEALRARLAKKKTKINKVVARRII